MAVALAACAAPRVPQPNLTVTPSGPGGTTTRTITQANVVASHHVGTQMPQGFRGPLYTPGEDHAFNGSRLYNRILQVTATTPYDPAVGHYVLRLDYGTYGVGDHMGAPDQDYDDCRMMLLDSLGGLGDNTGSWTIYVENEG